MQRKATVFSLIFSLIFSCIVTFNAYSATVGEDNQVQAQSFIEKYGKDVKIKYDKGAEQTFIWGLNTESSNKKAEDIASSFLSENADSLKIDVNNLKLKNCNEYQGIKHVSFEQLYKGIPVHGRKVYVHIKKSGEIGSIESRYYLCPDLDTTPAVTAEKAAQVIMDDLGIRELTTLKTSFDEDGTARKEFLPVVPELTIYPQEGGDARLSWKFIFTVEDPFGSWCYLVDAKSGKIIDKCSMLQGYTTSGNISGYTILTDPVVTPPAIRSLPNAQARTYYWYPYPGSWYLSTSTYANSSGNYSMTYNNGATYYYYAALPVSDKCLAASEYYGSIPGMNSPVYTYSALPLTYNFSLNWDPYTYYSNSDCVNLCFNITNSLVNFYQNTHGFNLGYQITAFAHCTSDPGNAFYEAGTRTLHYGAGNLNANNGARARDCILHELQHAVTDVIYNRAIYPPPTWDYGVINEAYSDYFACTQTNDPVFGEWWILIPSLVRNHALYYRFPENWTGVDLYYDMMVPGSTLWQIRSTIGQIDADRVIFGSIYYEPLTLSGLRLACELTASSLGLPPVEQAAISDTFAYHGIF